MSDYHRRIAEEQIRQLLQNFPSVAILGPRQCGKSTLARHFCAQIEGAIYLDLEKPADLAKLTDPALFFEHNSKALVCIDEVQLRPDLFQHLRSVLDSGNRNGQLLLLGSASRDLIRQSSESLAGRIVFIELTPFVYSEVDDTFSTERLWIRGGFPRSLLASSDGMSVKWRESFVQSYLERDIPQLGFNIPAALLRRLWTMLANSSGELLNSSKLGESLGVSHTTSRSYLDILEQTFMVRVLPPFEANVKKRVTRSPKVYVRDCGILHTLLQIDSFNDLLGRPQLGASWEGFVIEQLTAHLADMTPSFYRTSAGAEIDLLLSRGRRIIAVECKASSAPVPRRGFWNALDDIKPDEAWIIAPVKDSYFIKENVRVAGIGEFLAHYGFKGNEALSKR